VMVRVVRGKAPALQARWAEAGVKASYPGGERLRLVTHYGIRRRDIEEALKRISRSMRGR
ncbi:MAG: hypothetical protein Q8O40_04450, partial [Chloroflexota bacterium]|nr:hypothetical protein [Chloroflexota bacterium]